MSAVAQMAMAMWAAASASAAGSWWRVTGWPTWADTVGSLWLGRSGQTLRAP